VDDRAGAGGLPFPLEQGQHVSVIGDTGTGKTTVVEAILELCPWLGEYVIALRYKHDTVAWRGYKKVKTALPALDSVTYKRIVLEPRPTWAHRHREFSIALDRAFSRGGWTVFIDDLPNVQRLGPPIHSQRDSLIDTLLTAGRSVGNTIITAQQRPVDTTGYAIAESRLTVSFMQSGRDARTLREFTSSDRMEAAVSSLGEHEIAMFWRPTREVWVGRLITAEQGGPRFEGRLVAPSIERGRAALARS